MCVQLGNFGQLRHGIKSGVTLLVFEQSSTINLTYLAKLVYA